MPRKIVALLATLPMTTVSLANVPKCTDETKTLYVQPIAKRTLSLLSAITRWVYAS